MPAIPSPPAEGLYIGLMSGTSMDAVDAALVRFAPEFELICSHSTTLPDTLRQEAIALCQPTDNEIDRLGVLDRQLGELFADTTIALLKKANVDGPQIQAIGCHGQTVRHRPGADGFSLQLGSADVIACRTGITTINNFRNRDMVLDGQGAPLVPAFHSYLFGQHNLSQAIVNIGGMANITLLENSTVMGGYDTGPGNILMDLWSQQQRNSKMDEGGAWAATGTINNTLLERMLADPYFRQPAPKSTGREYFNAHWLTQFDLPAGTKDTQATLAELTARTIADSLRPSSPAQLLVCGGGAHNQYLMTRLAAQLPDTTVLSSAAADLDPDWVEACAFAWLAMARLTGLPGNAPAVTGAHKPAILGAVYAP